MASRREHIFAPEVEPGVFVYSLERRLPAATRKMVDRMVAEGAESTRRAAEAFRQALALRQAEGGPAH